MPAEKTRYQWFVSGDFNGLFGLFFDNLTVLAYLSGILIFAFGYPADIVYHRMFPGTALGVLVGDLIYTWMAFRLARRTGNPNVTAMPLGLDTPSTIGLALVVLGPAFVDLKSKGYSPHDAAMMTWYIGMATMMYMGILKLILSFFGSWVQRIVPAAGLLGSLAGIALGLIGVAPLLDIFSMPLVGLVSLGIVFYALVAGIRMPGRLPGMLVSVVFGTILYYVLAPHGLIGAGAPTPLPEHTWDVHPLIPTLDFIHGLGPALRYLPLAIPFGLLTVVGGVNVTESARVAGDDYNTRNILLTEALATIVAGLFGGVAQTTPYIGHPAYKNMGARSGYTVMTGLLIGIGGMLGQLSYFVQLIPRAVVAPILVFVALDIIMQAFHAVPKKHAPAVAFSFFPTIFRLLSIKYGNSGLVPTGNFNKMMTTPGADFNTLPEIQVTVALGNGFIITAMLWAAFLAKLIDRHLKASSGYLLILAGLSFFGIIHSALPEGSMYLPWGLSGLAKQIPYQFTMAYAALAALFFLLSFHRSALDEETIDHLGPISEDREPPTPPRSYQPASQTRES